MSKLRAAILAGYIPGDLGAFKPYAPGRMRLHEPLAEAVDWFVDEVVAPAFNWVIDEIIDPVMTTVSNVIEAALDNPIKTIAQIAAIATQQYWALPLIEGADVAAKGGDLGDVLEATAKAYVMQEIGTYVGEAAGTFAGETVAGSSEAFKAAQLAAKEAGTISAATVAASVVGSAARAGAVAVVSGQDPLKAMLTGGIGAAVPAVLGKVDGFTSLPPSAQRVIASAVSAQLSGGNVTAAVIGSAIAASDIVGKALKSFDPDGTKLDNAQRSILTDVLMGTATAALTGGSPTTAITAALMKVGSKALGDMATDAFKTSTTEATAAYGAADKTATQLDANQAAQKTAAANYNAIATALQTKIAEQDRLKGVYDAAVAAHNANPSIHTVAVSNTAIQAYNTYVTSLNKEYNETYRPALDKYGTELDTLKQTGAVLSGDYEKAIKAFTAKTDVLSEKLDPIYRTSNRAFVEVMDEKFNAEQYRALNGLAADQDPYEHFLAKGQFEGAPTNNAAAQPQIAEQRTRLVTEALAAKGVTAATADPVMVSQILNNIDAKYGNNIGAMKAASIQDVISGNTAPLAQLVSDQKDGVYRIEVKGGSYGEWNKPPTDRFTPPMGTKLASFEAFNNNTASLVYDTKGAPVWIEADPKTAVKEWNPASGDYTFPDVVITAKRPTEQERILAMSELTGADAVNGVVSQGMINAAKTLVGWAKDTGNSTVINTAANVIKAGGGFIESINGISALFGAVPKDTAVGKLANALVNVGKAGNTAQYQASIKDVKDMVGNAKGVGGTLAAIYKGATTYPLEFAAEFIGVEGFQEIAPFLIGGAATTAAKGLALARGVGQQLATRIGGVAGMTAAISTDVIESAGGAAAGAFDEAYKLAIKNGKTEAQATKIALDIAQKSGIVSGLVTAASMGLGGGALEKAIFNGKVSGTGFGDALTKLGDFAKTGGKITIKEGLSEGGEEGITQAFLEGQLYKLDPTRDVAANITAAAAFGMIAGGPIAGTAYAGSQAGDVISNALQANPQIASILETNKGNPAAADAALANLGITDNTIKSNLMNVVDDANYTSSQEAADTLAKRSDYSFTDADVTALTGKAAENTLSARVDAYVDPKVLDIEEIKAAAKAEGYTLTDEEAQKLVGQKDEIAAVAAARAEFDPKATTYDEAKGFLTAQGYTPSAEEIKQFVGDVAETKATADVAAYVNPRQVTTEEARKYLTEQGYTPTDADVKRFVGQVNEAEQAKNIAVWTDPRVVDEGEAKAAYEALGLKKPTADDVKRLMGQYEETGLAGKAEAALPTARYNSVLEQLDALAASSGQDQNILDAIALVKSDFSKQVADLGFKMDEQTGTLTDAITATEKSILDKVAANEKAGMTRDEATQKAVADVATELGTTKDDILKRINTTEENLAKTIDTLSKDVGALSTKLGDVETNIYAKMAEYEKTGIGRDEALGKAIADVATELGTTKEALLTQLGTTETNLKADVAAAETNLGAKIADSQEAILKELGLVKTGLSEEITASEGRTATKIGDVETNILSRVAEYEKAGIGRDEALGRAVDDVATELGTTRTDILTQIGTTETNLKADIAKTEAALTTKIGDVETTLGRAAVTPTQSDLDAIIQNLESQGAYDPQYDYNGDKVIDQNDRVAIENYLESQQPGYVPDTDTPFVFAPAAGSKFAPTGVFKTVAEEAAATRQAAANEAERTRQAQAAAALKTQRMGNLNTLTSMLGQAGDTGGQQVTVKAADPTKIGYVYDFSSIFANPSQEKMFASPFAQGGMVDGSDELNDELLKILKG